MENTYSKIDDLKIRVLQAKKKLPAHGLTTLYFHVFKVLPTDKEKSKINNVLQLRTSDPEVTENLEKLVEILNKAH